MSFFFKIKTNWFSSETNHLLFDPSDLMCLATLGDKTNCRHRNLGQLRAVAQVQALYFVHTILLVILINNHEFFTCCNTSSLCWVYNSCSDRATPSSTRIGLRSICAGWIFSLRSGTSSFGLCRGRNTFYNNRVSLCFLCWVVMLLVVLQTWLCWNNYFFVCLNNTVLLPVQSIVLDVILR